MFLSQINGLQKTSKKINNLAIFQTGKDNKKSIIFIHGFPLDHKMWGMQVDYLKQGFHCISYDISGLGKSPAGDGQYTIEGFVDDLIDIITELKLEKPVICGLSMGGYISLRAVEREEEKFGGLILCDTKADADNSQGKINRAGAIKEINLNGVEKFAENFVTKCVAEEFIKKHKNEYDEIVSRAKNSDPIGVKGCLLAMAARTDTASYLPKIKIPVLLLGGEKDALTPPDVMMAMADKISHAEFVIVPGAGHLSAVEKPDFFNSVIEKFLKTKLTGF